MKRIAFAVNVADNPQETRVFADGEPVGDVVAVRHLERRSGGTETYIVFRVKDAVVLAAEPGFEQSVRRIPGFEPGFRSA